MEKSDEEAISLIGDPYRNFIAAVIWRAVGDLHLVAEVEQRNKEYAREWIMAEGIAPSDSGFTFDGCCEALEIDPELTREAIFKLNGVEVKALDRQVRRLLLFGRTWKRNVR